MSRRLKSWFFGAPGSAYKKFSTGNEPDQQNFQELFNSVPFVAEVGDTAKTNEQGLVKIASDINAANRVDALTGAMTEAIVSHQLPELITTLAVTDATDGALVTGRGISIQPVKRTIGSIFRRVWKLANTLIFVSAGSTIAITEGVPGTVNLETTLKSSGGTVTVTLIAGGYDIDTTPGVGPPGADAIIIVKSNDALVPCSSSGTPSSYPTVLLQLWNGTSHKDMSGFNLADPTVFNPTVSNCTATYAHSGYDILVTLTAATADVGGILAQINYNGNWYISNILMSKVKSGAAANNWIWQGNLTTPPGGPSPYWWYTNPNTLYSYWYDGAIWQVLIYPAGESPTAYTTLTDAGLILTLDNTSKKEQIIDVPGGIVLAGPITISTTGTFPDGWKFNVIVDGGFDMNGEIVSIFGNVIDSATCLAGIFKVEGVYNNSTGASFKTMLIGNMPNMGPSIGALAAGSRFYFAYLTQIGGADPILVDGSNGLLSAAIYNTIGPIVWTRNGAGDYRGTLAGALSPLKTCIMVGSPVIATGAGIYQTKGIAGNVNYVNVQSAVGNAASDDALSATPVWIIVFP